MSQKKTAITTKTMVIVAIMTALVVVLQLMGSFIRFGMFSISLVLVPILIGAAVCGAGAGAWLGFAFSMAVLLSGDAAAFLAVNPFGTILTVLLKGTLAGLGAGIIYRQLSKVCASRAEKRTPSKKKWVNSVVSWVLKYIPIVTAAIACPVINTGVFLAGCRVFFFATIAEWGAGLGFANAAEYMFIGLAGMNFIVELVTNVVLVPVIVRLLSINEKIFKF